MMSNSRVDGAKTAADTDPEAIAAAQDVTGPIGFPPTFCQPPFPHRSK